MTKIEWENRLKVLGLPAFEYPYRLNDADKEAFFRRIMERYARAPEPGDPGFSVDAYPTDWEVAGAGTPYSLVSKPRIPSEVTVSPEDVQTWVGGNVLPDGQVVLSNEEILPSLQAEPEQIAPPDFYDEPFHVPTSVQDLASQVVTGSSYANKPPPLDELTPFTSTAPTAAGTLPSVQDITPLPRMAPPIDELSFTRAAPTAAPTLPPVQDITPFLPRREQGDAALAESLSPYMGPTSISRVSEAPEGYTQLPSGVEAPPPEIPYGVQVDEGMEGYVPERAETDAGIQFATDLFPTEEPVLVDEDDAVKDTPEDVAAGEDFYGRLDALGDMSSVFEFPSVGFIDPRIISNRDRWQKRRNVVRGFYGLAPKEIEWPKGAGGLTNAQMIEQWKYQKKRAAEVAYGRTLPQSEAQVLDLSNALGGGYLTELLDLHKKQRPDYSYESERFGALQAGSEFNQKLAASSIFADAMTEEGLDRQRFEILKKQAISEGRGGEAFEKEFKALIEIAGEKTPNLKRYAIGWRFKDTPANRKLYKDLGFAEGGRDGFRKFKDSDYMYITPDAAHTVKQFNVNDPEDVALINRLLRANISGVGEYDTISSPAQYMQIVDPQGIQTELSYDIRNPAMVDYASYLQSIGHSSMSDDKATQLATQKAAQMGQADYTRAQRDVRQAESVEGIVQALLNAHRRSIAKAREEGEEPEPIFGGIAGVKMSLENMQELGKDLNRALGVDMFNMGTSSAESSLALAEDSLNFLDSAITDARLNVPPNIDKSTLKNYENNVNVMSSDAAIWRSELEDLQREFAEGPTEADDIAWQGRIATKLLSTALATLVARLYSSTDRLLKQQYTDYRNQLNLLDLGMSEKKALVTLGIIGGLARKRKGDAKASMAHLRPSDYGIGETTGLLESSATDVSEALAIANREL